MLFFGLSGGIATGKSLVSTTLINNNINIIDADVLAREVVKPGKSAYFKVVKSFGRSILKANGEIDREKLSTIIFRNDADRRTLNRCVHPAIRLEILKGLIANFLKFQQLVVLDIPLLFETGLYRITSGNIVVYCSPEQELNRLQKRDNLSKEEAERKINTQLPLENKVKLADFIIDNSGSPENTIQQVEAWLKSIHEPWWKTLVLYTFLAIPSAVVYVVLYVISFFV